VSLEVRDAYRAMLFFLENYYRDAHLMRLARSLEASHWQTTATRWTCSLERLARSGSGRGPGSCEVTPTRLTCRVGVFVEVPGSLYHQGLTGDLLLDDASVQWRQPMDYVAAEGQSLRTADDPRSATV
jgi:hypothetical protein